MLGRRLCCVKHSTVSKISRRITVVVAAILSVLMFSTGIASAGTMSGLPDMATYVSAQNRLGTDGDEFSGAAYNASRDVIVVVDDGGLAYEFDVEGNGSIDFGTPARRITINTGGDPEGVAWISDDNYAIVHEDSGIVAIVTIDASTTNIGPGDVLDTFSVVPSNYVDNNMGPEGLDTDGTHWYVPTEFPAKLTRFTIDGEWAGEIQLSTDLSDASGVAVAPNGTLLVLSHESRTVLHLDVDWTNENYDILGSLDISGFTQAEGITVVGSNVLHVFGEDKGGWTYAQYNGPISIITSDVEGDVDCTGNYDILDARMVAQVHIGTAQTSEECGNGDVNGDGDIDLVDARLIAQCSIGMTNEFCEDGGTSQF